MNDHDSLIQAVCDFPAEDTPRLMFADFLQERGWKGDKERAEFIQVQVELEQWRNSHDALGIAGVLRHHPLFKREQAILCAAIDSGRSPIPGWAVFNAPSRVFLQGVTNVNRTGVARRGFLEHISLDTHDFLTHAAGVFTRHPVEKVTLVGKQVMQVTSTSNPWQGLTAWYTWINAEKQRWHENPQRENARIPRELFDFVASVSPQCHFDEYARFTFANDAHKALSDACCDIGRARSRNARLGATVAT